jgi:hypothetical protein
MSLWGSRFGVYMAGKSPSVACITGMKSPLHGKRNTEGNKANHAITCYPIQPCHTRLHPCSTSLQETKGTHILYQIYNLNREPRGLRVFTGAGAVTGRSWNVVLRHTGGCFRRWKTPARGRWIGSGGHRRQRWAPERAESQPFAPRSWDVQALWLSFMADRCQFFSFLGWTRMYSLIRLNRMQVFYKFCC